MNNNRRKWGDAPPPPLSKLPWKSSSLIPLQEQHTFIEVASEVLPKAVVTCKEQMKGIDFVAFRILKNKL